jgi:hypothetical protein
MIDIFDDLIRYLFMTRILGLTFDHIRFQPPDEHWRNHVSLLQDNALNIYLVEVRENMKLRLNERTTEVVNGFASTSVAPRRVDCHYLITAWSLGAGSPAVYLIVTLLVALDPPGVVPVVTTGTVGFLQGGKPATAEALALIGGTVLDNAGHVLGQAWVRLETAAGQPLAVVTTDDLGRFIIDNLVITT